MKISGEGCMWTAAIAAGLAALSVAQLNGCFNKQPINKASQKDAERMTEELGLDDIKILPTRHNHKDVQCYNVFEEGDNRVNLGSLLIVTKTSDGVTLNDHYIFADGDQKNTFPTFDAFKIFFHRKRGISE